MAKYLLPLHIAPAAGKILIGKINKKGDKFSGDAKDITNEFLLCAIHRWNGHEEIITETDENGIQKKYKITCEEVV
jgi:hypothetical protein